MFPINRRSMWGLLWTRRQKWQLHFLMPAEPDSPAIPSEVCVPTTKWPGLSLAWEGLGFIFILHVFWDLKMKHHPLWWLFSVPQLKPEHDPFIPVVVGLEGRRKPWKTLDPPCPTPSWRTMLCDQGCAPHFPPFQFPLMCTHDRHMSVGRVEWWGFYWSIRTAVAELVTLFEQLAIIMTLGRLLLELLFIII